MKYGLVVFREGIIINNDLHEKNCSQIHPNKWVLYTSQSQSMVQSRRDQNGAWISIVPNQLQDISSPKSMTN
jgi:hypothetical protein